jgi:hypothetical protein
MTRREFAMATVWGAGVGLRVASAAQRVRITDSPGEKLSFRYGDRPLFEYRYTRAAPKTYVHPLHAPDGRALTLDSPPDHVHHRGVMLAWSDVKTFDFWGETNPGPPHGPIAHQRFESRRRDSVTAVNHWIGKGEVLVIERQTVRAPAPDAHFTWLEWESELRAPAGPLTLSAKDHPYDGMGIRFVHGMDKGNVLNSHGTATIAGANGENAAWCAYSGPLDGRPAGAAIFDHPENPRHPAPFFVMNDPFGYLSAAPTFREPFVLGDGERLRLRYAVVTFNGAPDRPALDSLYQRWSKQEWNRS